MSNRDSLLKPTLEELNAQYSIIEPENRVKYLMDRVQETTTEIRNLITPEERIINEITNDFYKNQLEEELAKMPQPDEEESDLWQGYPELTDENFNMKIYQKREFNRWKIPRLDIETFSRPKTGEFVKDPVQNLVGSYMNPNTIFNGVLLWYGVGVGKTCASITIAENYRKDNSILSKNKITILLPSSTLAQSWKDQIFSLDKYQKNKNPAINVQCTGDSYVKELNLNKKMNQAQMERRVNRVIGAYYKFYGYRKFANSVNDQIKKEIGDRTDKEFLKIQLIKRKYSNRVFILDEVHSIRPYGNRSETKDILEVLELIARYGENNKFILASATPMYNSTNEIVDIINLLLLNDKRGPMNVSDIFKKNGVDLKDGGKEILLKKTRGYISYLRGENPVTFPVKIYPDIPGLTYVPQPTFRKDGKKFKSDDMKITGLKFIKDTMSDFQYSVYQEILGDFGDENDSIDEERKGDLEGDNFNTKTTAACNIVFPIKIGDEIEGVTGDKGFDDVFDTIQKNQNEMLNKYTYKDKKNKFLEEDQLAKYSAKLYNILQIEKKSRGISFIFSKRIKTGILSAALMLEQNGYARFSEGGSGGNFLREGQTFKRCYCGLKESEHTIDRESPNYHEFIQGKYIYLSGNTSKSDLNDLVKISNNKVKKYPNLYGESIRFILGSAVVEQGINFMNVRSVHIMDPWFHFNKIEQAVGRAIRNKSHIELPSEERNVSVYLHCATIPEEYASNPEKDVETTDEAEYRIALYKSKKTAIVSRYLKQNAFDCMLNKNGNELTEQYFNYTPLNIITSMGQRLKNQFYGDKDGSMICDYQKCNYVCFGQPEQPYEIKMNNDTYDDILSEESLAIGKKYIIELFLNKSAYTIDEMTNNVDRYLSIDKDLLFRALNKMVIDEEIVFDKYNRTGTIQYVHPYYVFLPRELPYITQPLVSRMLPLSIRKDKFKYEAEAVSDDEDEKEDEALITDTFIQNLREYIRTFIEKQSSDKNLNKIVKESFCKSLGRRVSSHTVQDMINMCASFMVLDRLNYEQKVILLKYICKKRVDNGGVIDTDDQLELAVFRFWGDKENPRRAIFYEGNTTKPQMFRLYKVVETDGSVEIKPVFYEWKGSRFSEVVDIVKYRDYLENKEYNFDYNTIAPNDRDRLFGYLQEKNEHAKSELETILNSGRAGGNVQFYLVNRIDHSEKKNKDGQKQLKSVISGTVCGTAIKKQKIIDIVGYIVDFKESNILDYIGKKSIKGEFLVPSGNMENINVSQMSYCDLTELFLRFKQFCDVRGHHFYNFEERLFIRATTFIEEEKRKKEIEKRKAENKRGRRAAAEK